MKKILYIIMALATLSCNNNRNGQEKGLCELRAEKDTVLAFQGIKISEPLDSIKYEEVRSSIPITLYDKDNKAFKFTSMSINNSEYATYPGVTVEKICLLGQIDKYWDFLSLICLYEDSYGCFSYLKRYNQKGETMGSFPIGKVSQLTGKPWTRMDAVSDLIEYGESSLYEFTIVWEWKNQSIILYYNPGSSILNTTILYENVGFEQRQANEEKQKMLQESEQEKINNARRNQQI